MFVNIHNIFPIKLYFSVHVALQKWAKFIFFFNFTIFTKCVVVHPFISYHCSCRKCENIWTHSSRDESSTLTVKLYQQNLHSLNLELKQFAISKQFFIKYLNFLWMSILMALLKNKIIKNTKWHSIKINWHLKYSTFVYIMFINR